uniref:Uncharacterized protein n=1 Tax=Salix viminalis TaxID=40686 RepID=A0A6N2LHN9_SALVM
MLLFNIGPFQVPRDSMNDIKVFRAK